MSEAAKKPVQAVKPVAVEKEAPAESKEAKFQRLARARVGKARKTILLIGNLSGSGYAYNEQQVANIRKILVDAVNDTLSRFVKGTVKKEEDIVI